VLKRLGHGFYFGGTDTTQRQQPNFHAQLIPVGEKASSVNVALIEVKSEGIVRKFSEDIVRRGKEHIMIDWEGENRWDLVDRIVIKVLAVL
jgi:hypothetical protein